MDNFVMFQMWEPFRQSLIKGHVFYVEQAKKRLLSQFDSIDADADQASKEWLDQRSQYFDPDKYDPEQFYERACDAGIEFYKLLRDMREQTRLSVVAGMFHEWEKQLRDWLVSEMKRWYRGTNATSKVWSATFVEISELLESFGWNLRTASYFSVLDACRLVVNVYKHGDGKSLDDLRSTFPMYLDDPFNGSGGMSSLVENRDHTDLKISDAQFQEFSDAILAFWRDVPENVLYSQVSHLPKWFDKALQK